MGVWVAGLDVVRPPRTVLSNLSFEVPTGRRLAIVGPSGCGKTSLLRVLAGLDSADTGTVLIADLPVHQARHLGRISMAFQQPALLPWAGALDNVLLPVRLRGRPTPADLQRATELLSLMEIDPAYWAARPDVLSGGMRQRVALAGALLPNPSVLLLDEPFASVDEITRFRLAAALDTVLDGERQTALLVTHSVAEALVFADRVLVLGGRPATIVADVPVTAPRGRSLAAISRPPLAGLADRVLRALGFG